MVCMCICAMLSKYVIPVTTASILTLACFLIVFESTAVSSSSQLHHVKNKLRWRPSSDKSHVHYYSSYQDRRRRPPRDSSSSESYSLSSENYYDHEVVPSKNYWRGHQHHSKNDDDDDGNDNEDTYPPSEEEEEKEEDNEDAPIFGRGVRTVPPRKKQPITNRPPKKGPPTSEKPKKKLRPTATQRSKVRPKLVTSKPVKRVRLTTTTKRPADSRIVGGKMADKYFYKSIVAVKIMGQVKCGGSIIKEDWVVTAAHCLIVPPEGKYYAVVAAEHQLSTKEGPEQTFQVKKVIPHDKYKTLDDGSTVYDICLFQLEKSFKFDDKIQPAAIPYKHFDTTGLATAVGWGKLNKSEDILADILQHVRLPIITNERCKQLYPDKPITAGVICTEHLGGGKDACQGDSGGPLYLIENEVQILVGIVSWGEGCADNSKPGVYTRVTHYLDWIEGHTGNLPKKLKPPKPTQPTNQFETQRPERPSWAVPWQQPPPPWQRPPPWQPPPPYQPHYPPGPSYIPPNSWYQPPTWG